jgi:hypothetical protein
MKYIYITQRILRVVSIKIEYFLQQHYKFDRCNGDAACFLWCENWNTWLFEIWCAINPPFCAPPPPPPPPVRPSGEEGKENWNFLKCYIRWLKSPCAILRSVVRVRMDVTVHERGPGVLVLKVRQRFNVQMDEYNLTWYIDKMPYPLPAPCTTILKEVHRDFSFILYLHSPKFVSLFQFSLKIIKKQ